jgi:hypothetical protein
MRYILYSLVFTLLAGCGESEKNPCKKLVDIWQGICSIPEGLDYPCFPCSCALCGRYWNIPHPLGLPDLNVSDCGDFEPCEGDLLAIAETCLEHAPEKPYELDDSHAEWIANECDPRYTQGIWLADGDCMSYNEAIPEVLDAGRYTYDCGK